VELSELQTFIAVVEERGFSRAAKRLHRSQPAVSQTIRKLEDELGQPLLDRSLRDGTLTAAGTLIYEYAQKLVNLRSEATVALGELQQMSRGKLAIGANEFTSLCLLPLLDEFRRLYPAIKIEVHRCLGSRIADDLLNHKVELGVLSFHPESSELRCIVIYRDQLAFILHPQHPLARRKKVRIQHLGAELFIAHNVPSPYRVKVLRAFERSRTPLNMGVELPTIEAIKSFVAMGNGVALVPRMSVRNELASGELVTVSVPELQFERKLRLVYRKRSPLSHAAQAFLTMAEALAKSPSSPYLFQREGAVL
jgi:DNA-binding transcriptional LysR family regulator